MSNNVNNYDLAWYAKGDWKEGLQAQPDETVNKEEFIRQYAANPELWQKAFRFLASPGFPHLAAGKHVIDGENLFVNINEYITKNAEDALCEGHIKYADIQFMISGEELMGLTPLSDTQNPTPYSEEKDMYFMQPNNMQYYLADTSRFFIFFPNDAHRPAVKVKDNVPVKKAIVKVRIA
ncbi:MAG: YhcH/YjgK/YiaL family protein [Dysgonamonadaceae bacterium]|jgi:YhcH/YjgK/YiaL family protein|nr:YhcH/YjgK/YiaL family protein [Dysgonamonadaceae bacterium]